MPTIPPLPQTMAAVLPFISLIVVDWLHHSTLPRWANVLIGLAVPLFLATIWALLSNALTLNLSGDIALLVALCYAVMALPDIAPLRDWLQSTLVSPAALLAHQQSAPEPAITASTVPAAPTPYAIDLPTSPASSRVSRIPFDSSFRPLPPVLPTGPMPAVTPSPHTTQPMPTTTPEPATPVEESPAQR